MIKIRIEDVVGIAGNEYRVVGLLPGGFHLQGLELGGAPEFFSLAEIEEVRAEGLLTLGDARRPAKPFEEEWARYSQALCDGFLALREDGLANLTDLCLRSVLPDIHADWIRSEVDTRENRLAPICGRLPSPSTFRRWLRRYDGSRASLLRRYPVRRTPGGGGVTEGGLALRKAA